MFDMRNKVFFKFIYIFVALLLSKNTFGVEAEIGKWNFFKEENYCFIVSLPTKEEGNYQPTNRGNTYIMVYRINKSLESVFYVIAGYNYNKEELIEIKIDNSKYELFSVGDDSAWSKNQDKDIIYAMKKGNTLILKGTSSRGNLTTDTYTLKGFTVAFNKLSKEC